MIHPLLRLVATQPQLLADHAEAYAGLVGEELGKTASSIRRRAVFNVVALCLVAVAAVLAGVALMLWSVTPPTSLQAPWALIAAPAVPVLLAAWCAYIGRSTRENAFSDLKQQIAADLALLREVSVA